MKKIIDKIAWILISDNRVLSVLSMNKNVYYLPGGKREPNESDHECLKREILEELSVEIDDRTIKYFNTFKAQADGHQKSVSVNMVCYFSSFSGELKPSNEIEKFGWISYNEKDKLSKVSQKVIDQLKTEGYIV